jgi:hypothetical protein
VSSSRFIRAATTAMNAATIGMHPATAKMVAADTTSDKTPVTAVDTGTRAKVSAVDGHVVMAGGSVDGASRLRFGTSPPFHITNKLSEVDRHAGSPDHRPVFKQVWAERFSDHRPARSAIQAPDFGRKGENARFMIDVAAYRG